MVERLKSPQFSSVDFDGVSVIIEEVVTIFRSKDYVIEIFKIPKGSMISTNYRINMLTFENVETKSFIEIRLESIENIYVGNKCVLKHL